MIALREGWTYVVPGGSLQGYHLSCKRAEKIPQHHTITQHGLRNALLTKGKTHEAKVMEAEMQACHPHCSHTIITPQRCTANQDICLARSGFLSGTKTHVPIEGLSYSAALRKQTWQSGNRPLGARPPGLEYQLFLGLTGRTAAQLLEELGFRNIITFPLEGETQSRPPPPPTG